MLNNVCLKTILRNRIVYPYTVGFILLVTNSNLVLMYNQNYYQIEVKLTIFIQLRLKKRYFTHKINTIKQWFENEIFQIKFNNIIYQNI